MAGAVSNMASAAGKHQAAPRLPPTDFPRLTSFTVYAASEASDPAPHKRGTWEAAGKETKVETSKALLHRVPGLGRHCTGSWRIFLNVYNSFRPVPFISALFNTQVWLL